MKRTLVIGDIHGGLRALAPVLEKAASTRRDRLIFLGDYVDGWSESAQVLDFVIDLATQQDCVFIKGNHDVWCEEWLRSGTAGATWLQHGGRESIASYAGKSGADKQQHLHFLQNMPYYFIDEENRLFIHAGFTSPAGPQVEMMTPGFSWDRSLWEAALALDKDIQKDPARLPPQLKLFSEIFIGHTPTLYFDRQQPMNACNVWNIDTGAAFTGRLTVMDVLTKQYWQSEPLFRLYPTELGRNK